MAGTPESLSRLARKSGIHRKGGYLFRLSAVQEKKLAEKRDIVKDAINKVSGTFFTTSGESWTFFA